jgi:hypothetical protein
MTGTEAAQIAIRPACTATEIRSGSQLIAMDKKPLPTPKTKEKKGMQQNLTSYSCGAAASPCGKRSRTFPGWKNSHL